MAFQKVHEVGKIILADIVACKKHLAVAWLVSVEAVAQRLNHSLSTKIAAADADSHHKFARFAKRFGCGFDVGEFSFGNTAWKVEPTEEIVALTCAFFKFFYCVNSLLLQCVNLALVDVLTESGEIRYLNLF